MKNHGFKQTQRDSDMVSATASSVDLRLATKISVSLPCKTGVKPNHPLIDIRDGIFCPRFPCYYCLSYTVNSSNGTSNLPRQGIHHLKTHLSCRYFQHCLPPNNLKSLSSFWNSTIATIIKSYQS